ncbi:D-2-hydroxyacid dehydrogenase family protein [Amorphus sp. MBR-141]
MTKIAILDDYQNVALDMADWSALSEAEITVFDRHIEDEAALAAALQPFDVIAIMRERTPFPRSLFARLPALKLLVTSGMKNAAVDLDAARDHGVAVCGTASSGHATAELSFLMILSLARKLPEQMASMREGGWQVGLGRDLRGTRLGLLGMGRLGTEMAKFGTAFGMDVVGWSQNLTPEAAEAAGARYVEKAELFATSDFVSVHLRLSDRTQGIVGREDIARMKPDACLINTSRGGLVDNDALVAALEAGRLGGAALDVYDHEPLPADDPLRSVPGLLLTPHIGYVTRESYEVFYPETVEAIRAWLDGKPVRVLA